MQNCYFSVTKSCPTLCEPLGCSIPGFTVLHYLLEFVQNVHWVGDAIQTSHPLFVPFSSWLLSFPAWGSFPMSWLFASGRRSIGASASASVLPMNFQGWLPLGLTGLISLQSQGTLKHLPQHHNQKASILCCSALFMVQISHPYMTPEKTITFTILTIISKSDVSAFLMCFLGLSEFFQGASIF